MRSLLFIAPFLLVACEDTVEDAGSVVYEGRSELTVAAEEPDAPSSTPLLDGRYGASAADCDEGNRYMTEYVEIDGATFSYRGIERGIAVVREDAITLRGGEELARAGNALIRWPEQRRKRTVYTRCP